MQPIWLCLANVLSFQLGIPSRGLRLLQAQPIIPITFHLLANVNLQSQTIYPDSHLLSKYLAPHRENAERFLSQIKVLAKISVNRTFINFSHAVEVIPLKDQDLPVTSERPSEPQPSEGEKSVDGETSSLISMLVSSIPTEKKEKDRKYFNKAKTDQPATDAQDTTRKEKETEEDDERAEGEKDHDLEMFDEEDTFLNAFMKAEKPKADKADRPSSSDEPEKKVEKEPKEKKKFNFKF